MPKPPRANFYDDDLAFVHDAGFGGFAEASAPGLLRTLAEAGVNDGLVVDLGCGSGIWAQRLVEDGYDVFGVDVSPAMIRLARKRAPGASFQVGSFLDVRLPQCRAVTALGEVLSYRFDNRYDAKSLERTCRRVYDALENGGLLIFDLVEIGLDVRPPSFREGDGWACLFRSEVDPRKQRLARHIVSFRKAGSTYRRREETHCVQLYAAGDVAAMLRAIGFRVRQVRRYGEHPLLDGRVGFVARKPAA